ncbi:MAG: TonB-dependent receptor [Mangrovibacterium sp.]
MKLTLALVTLTVFSSLAADLYSQNTKLSLENKNEKIISLLRAIEDQSEFRFFFNEEIDLTPTVSINKANATIKEVLDKIFENTAISYEIIGRQIILKSKAGMQAVQQQKTVSGTVNNESGESVPGATVLVKGTTNGTVTDADGAFTLRNVPVDAVLLVSFVGMKSQEVNVAGKTTINIRMEEETIGIEEVVAVGYGVQKKVNLTGAVSAVKIGEEITSRALSNVSSGLSGLLPGLAVSQNTGMAGKNNASLLIRGLGTVNNANPLIVVDGMPDVDINRLNMNDIESISVLKDAASSAVYGSRAANGVILVTTRTGKAQDKTKVNISSTYTVGRPTGNYSYMSDYARSLTLHQRVQAVSNFRENFNFKDGTIDQWMALGMIDPLRYPNTDWWDIILRNSKLTNHDVSFSGGNDRFSFFISAGIMDEEGLQINNDYTLYNARFNGEYKVRPNMNIGIRFGGNWSKWLYSESEGFTFFSGNGSLSIQNAVAGITPYDPETGLYGGIMAYNENQNAYNAYSVYMLQLNHQNRQEVLPSLYWDWTPVKGLTARLDYALNYYNQFRWNAYPPNIPYNFQTNSVGTLIRVAENAPVNNYSTTGYKTQMSGRLNYHTIIGENHEINALVVYSEEYWYDRSMSGYRYDRIHSSMHEIDAALTNTIGINGSSSTEGLRSYVGRLNYSAFDKYLFEASFRYDGSSKFIGKNQFGFFPSVALGWRFTEEDFLKPFTENFLTSGKFRFSYGGLGNNSGVGRYEQKVTLATQNYIINQSVVKGFVNKKMVNPDLSWESTYVMNLGLDLGFLNNRLTCELDYYDRLTTDMNRPSDMSIFLSGLYQAPRKNIGDMRNRGVEGNFIWMDKAGDFSYKVNLNVSYNRNRLEKWNELLLRGTTFIDMPIGFVYSYEDRGIAQTWEDVYNATPQGAAPGDILLIDVNGDGRIDGNDRKAYPQYNLSRPTTNFGLNINLAWKGIDLSCLVQGSAGRKDFWLNAYNQSTFSASYAPNWRHWNNSWSLENRDGSWPRLGGSSNNRGETTFWLDDMSYIRLKNIQLGYTIPHHLFNKLGVDNLRIYGTAENLFTFTKYRGIDPEKQNDASDPYPLVKSFSIGINIGI